MKLDELLNEHPELSNEKKQIEAVVSAFAGSKIPIDKSFSQSLKSSIREKIKEKKAQNPNYFLFYLRHFRFYFTGFSVALGCFLILFVLGFFNFNAKPQILNNPKLLAYVGPEAFWRLSSPTTNAGDPERLSVAHFSDLLESTSEVYSGDETILTAANPRYHIGEKQLPKLPSVILVGKNVNSNSSNMQFLSKNIKLPEFSLSPFKKDTITTIDFENDQLDYHFTINLDQGLFSAIKNSAYNSLTGSDVPLLSEKEIKKRVKSQISNFWLSLKFYGEPELKQSEHDFHTFELFYPRVIDGKEVWDPDTNTRLGMQVSFDLENQEIISLYSFQFQSYELSKYPQTKSPSDILESISKLGNINISKNKDEGDIPMNKGKEIYLQKWDFLFPGLLFQAQDAKINTVFLVSLY